MTTSPDPKIEGYRDLTNGEINTINEIKDIEKELGRYWKRVNDMLGVDKRWTSIAKTHFEEGFSALVRSIARPVERF